VPEPDVVPVEQAFSFGPFRLLPTQQLLLEADRPVRLGSRALDILVMLVERAGELVSKDELVARVWPDTHVEEGNLRVHVAAVRRALGDGHAGNRFVANVPGRGYCFVAPVALTRGQTDTELPSAKVLPAHNLRSPLTRMVGRGAIVRSLMAQLPQRRFITIVGPGGIGKTTVALAVAEGLVVAYHHGVRLVDLAPVGDPDLVPSALAAVLGLEVRSDNPVPGVVAFLADKRMLLVLDNCEHVIEAVAALVADVRKAAPGVHILATSREPLRVEGERLHRLPPLSVPAGSTGLTAAEALGFPAVQLFVERAAAILDGFELSDADAPLVAEICRRLDGIALAIELAAGRVEAFGVSGLAALLDDRLRLLRGGRRSALPRHQAMSAVLDWSYQLLPERERTILRRLAVFAGDFLLESAAAVAGGVDIAAPEVVDAVANLVAKSLISADVGGPTVRYRLLDTTRAYALQKLRESCELEGLTRRHAEHYRELLERAEAEWPTEVTTEWLAAYAFQIDNVRAALDWAFSPAGDVEIGIALTLAAVPLWFQLSLINECRAGVERALETLDAGSGRGGRREMQLYAALGWSQMYTTGSMRETGAGWATALELAEAQGDTDYQLRALWGLWAGRINNAEFRPALELAQRFHGLAVRTADPADLDVGDRMLAASLHFLGDQSAARRHIERMLARYVAPLNRSHIVRFQFDQRVTARITLARVLWLQGLPDQAMRCVESTIEHARSIDHVLSLCNALAQAACPVALLAGDLAAADRFTAMLLEHTRTHALDLWDAYGRLFRGELLVGRGEVDGGLRLIRGAVGELGDARFNQYRTAFLSTLAQGLAAAGQLGEASAAIEEALAQSERAGERWCVAELLRIRGELAVRQGRSAGEQDVRSSLETAHAQGALSWELRTATSLARLQRSRDHIAEARHLLAAVYSRFTEGFGTADLRAAQLLLQGLT
jgi:predicted ATPase/DNA-binding winged helix-turn-helix (wHTH) protein